MFYIIRLAIGCLFFVCSVVVIKKLKTNYKRLLYIVFASVSIVLIVVLYFFPFENIFVTFSSPKAAYEYYNFGDSNVALVIEGNDCGFVIDEKNDSNAYLIIPKTTDGWKIGIGSDTKRISQTITDGITIYIYQYKNTSDCFITVLDTNGGKLNISDGYNTKFQPLEHHDDFLGKTYITYYAHIPNFNSKYSIMVNGNTIVLG